MSLLEENKKLKTFNAFIRGKRKESQIFNKRNKNNLIRFFQL